MAILVPPLCLCLTRQYKKYRYCLTRIPVLIIIRDMDITNALVSTRCPNLQCNRPMVERPAANQTPEQRFCGVWWDCPRCGTSVLYPSVELEQQLAEQRASVARDAARQDPVISEAFESWRSGAAYWDGKGYRIKGNGRSRATWSKAATKLYPDCADFHEAARLASL